MAEFERSSDGILLELEDHEADLLRSLLQEMATLLEADVRSDPVTQRLFPDAYESDEDSAAYHELVGNELRSQKNDAVRQMRAALGETGSVQTTLTTDEAATWLPVLTDIRLAIGTRNDVTEDMMNRELDPGEAGSAGLLVLHWLGWVQESLLKVIAADPADPRKKETE